MFELICCYNKLLFWFISGCRFVKHSNLGVPEKNRYLGVNLNKKQFLIKSYEIRDIIPPDILKTYPMQNQLSDDVNICVFLYLIYDNYRPNMSKVQNVYNFGNKIEGWS